MVEENVLMTKHFKNMFKSNAGKTTTQSKQEQDIISHVNKHLILSLYLSTTRMCICR